MADYGTRSPELDVSDLFVNRYEPHNIRESNSVIELNNELITRMEKLQRLITELSMRTDDIDWTSSERAELRQLVDEAGKIAPALFSPGNYRWTSKEAERLKDTLQHKIIHELSPKVSQNSNELTRLQHESNEVLEIITNILKDLRKLKEVIQGNIRKH